MNHKTFFTLYFSRKGNETSVRETDGGGRRLKYLVTITLTLIFLAALCYTHNFTLPFFLIALASIFIFRPPLCTSPLFGRGRVLNWKPAVGHYSRGVLTNSLALSVTDRISSGSKTETARYSVGSCVYLIS